MKPRRPQPRRRPPARVERGLPPTPAPLPRAGQRLAELEEIELTIDRLVAGGEGLARFEGIPIFVPRSAPGDRVRARLVERRPDYGRAEIVELLAPGPGRRPAPCPYFARCGGCDLQHLEDERQTDCAFDRMKQRLDEALAKRGLVALHWSKVGSIYLFCDKPRRTPAEAGNAKVWAWEGDPKSVEAYSALGLVRLSHSR